MRAQEAIDEARILVGDEYGDVHTDEKMLVHLNRVVRNISTDSRCLVEGTYLPARAGQAQYGLPEGFLRLDIAGWKQPDGRYLPMEPITMDIAAWAIHNDITGTPTKFDVFGRAAIERVVETISSVDTFVPYTPGGERGSFTFTSSSASLILKRGDRVVNVTDGSSTGHVSRVNSTRGLELEVIYTELKGGTRGYFEAGDEVRILSPGNPLHSLVVSPVPSDVGDTGHEALFLYAARAHRKITAGDIEYENDNIELDIEFESAMIDFLVSRMLSAEQGSDSTAAQARMVSATTAYYRVLPNVRRRIRQWIVRWYARQQVPMGRQFITRDPVADYPIGSRGEIIR